jgi:hypothetical protein
VQLDRAGGASWDRGEGDSLSGCASGCVARGSRLATPVKLPLGPGAYGPTVMDKTEESAAVSRGVLGWRRTRVVGSWRWCWVRAMCSAGDAPAWAGPRDSDAQTASLPVGPRASVLLNPEVVVRLDRRLSDPPTDLALDGCGRDVKFHP